MSINMGIFYVFHHLLLCRLFFVSDVGERRLFGLEIVQQYVDKVGLIKK